ncbi:hypothetical protein V6N13_104361 [Hibiscus sabdariffa]|uniref:CCT domain-containing protein n=1 Tax=Hibiscus sabdariffa TaxID=183260 RepID=A0ABR2DI18_9ROSI
MLQDMIHPPEQLPIEDIQSRISGSNFYFSDNDLFSEALQNSEVTDENSSHGNKLNIPPDSEHHSAYQNNGNTNSATSTPAATNNHNNNFSIIFDSSDDISASIDFSDSQSFSVPPFLTQQDQFELSLVQSHIQLPDVSAEGLSQYTTDTVGPLLGPPLVSAFEEDCLPSYVPLNHSSSSCSFLAHPMATFMPADSSGIFAERFLLNSELQPQDLEFQGDNGGIFSPDSVQRVFKLGDLQGLSTDTQQLVGVATTSSTPLVSEISSLEDSTSNKVGKLSVEERKEKIHRYMKKRNQRNFSKKIKVPILFPLILISNILSRFKEVYACRKTLADSRPRVRGRFAKNDEFGETHRQVSSNHEEEYDDEVVVKEEGDMVDSSDIFAHLSGVNSFKCSCPIQSWI